MLSKTLGTPPRQLFWRWWRTHLPLLPLPHGHGLQEALRLLGEGLDGGGGVGAGRQQADDGGCGGALVVRGLEVHRGGDGVRGAQGVADVLHRCVSHPVLPQRPDQQQPLERAQPLVVAAAVEWGKCRGGGMRGMQGWIQWDPLPPR